MELIVDTSFTPHPGISRSGVSANSKELTCVVSAGRYQSVNSRSPVDLADRDTSSLNPAEIIGSETIYRYSYAGPCKSSRLYDQVLVRTLDETYGVRSCSDCSVESVFLVNVDRATPTRANSQMVFDLVELVRRRLANRYVDEEITLFVDIDSSGCATQSHGNPRVSR